MNALITAILGIGAIASVAFGFAGVALLLWLSAKATGKYAWRTWDNLATIYKLETMRYYFKLMQDNGTHSLRLECERANPAAEPKGGEQ